MDFEGDQWTFFKPPPEDLELLFGIDIHEMQPYRPLPLQARRADRQRPHADRRARLLVPARHRGDQLPQRARQELGRDRGDRPRGASGCATSTAPACTSSPARTTAASSASAASSSTDVLPPYTELVRFDAGPALRGDELRDAAPARCCADTSPRRPASNPFLRFGHAARATTCRACWRATSPTYHAYAFATVRMVGAAFEVAASHVDWLLGRGRGQSAATRCARIVEGCKALSLQARPPARVRPERRRSSELAAAWDEAMARLEELVG